MMKGMMMDPGIFFMTLWGTALLFAMGFGYIICYLAGKQQKALKTIGYCVGGFIIVVSLVLILGKALWLSGICSKQCPIMKGRGGMGMMQRGQGMMGQGKGMMGQGMMGAGSEMGHEMMREQSQQ